jgi:hypothetical protein
VSTETELAISISQADIVEIKRGVHTRILVDKAVFGVKELLVLGVYPGTAEAIDKIIGAVEAKSSMQANLSFIKEKNQNKLKGDASILSRGQSQIDNDEPSTTDGEIGSSVPPSNRSTNSTAQPSDLQDYIKEQNVERGTSTNESES